jgi:hypothetical protein
MGKQSQFVSFIKYQIQHLTDDNEHHKFETICRAVARLRVCRRAPS